MNNTTVREANRALDSFRYVFATVAGQRIRIIRARTRAGRLQVKPLNPAPTEWVDADAGSLEVNR